MAKLLVASEYTEPSTYLERVLSKLRSARLEERDLGFLLITKNILSSLPIWEEAKSLGIPTITHTTITGLGGSQVEPGVPHWQESLVGLSRLLSLEKDPSRVVLRVDPLIPGVSDFKIIELIALAASKLGISRCRTSVVDYYPFVRTKFLDQGLPAPKSNFQPPLNVKVDLLSRLLVICEEYSMTLESCAEDVDVPGLIKVGCADRSEWARLGITLPIGYPKREECFCNVTKYDLLSHEPICSGNCLYCYWGKFR